MNTSVYISDVDEMDAEAKKRGYISEVSFLVDKKLNKKDYIEVWPDMGWFRLRMPKVIK